MIAGTEDFIKEILKAIEDELTISKVEKDNFRYTGQDISTAEDGSITIEMQDYVDSLDDIKEIPWEDNGEPLTKIEMKEHRKATGNISWLANSTRPDMSYVQEN